MQKDFKANRNEILKYISSVDLLVIDDFGAESKDKLTLGDVFSIINERYENNKTMIVTTNYPRRSFCLISTGGATIEIIKKYIERQGEKT